MKTTTLLLLLVAIGFYACGETKNVPETKSHTEIEYQESTENIANPERGFYAFQEFRSNDNNTLSTGFVDNLRANGMTLVYTTYTMPDYRDKAIPTEFINRIKANMEVLRSHGCKCVLRFRYTSSTEDKPWDAPEDVLHGHISQLAPLFREYADVIAVLEAGFIGVWGEWYYTDHYTFRPQQDQYEPRRRVLKALLDALPKERMVLVRYPAAKLYSFGISYADSITQATAYDESDLARVGAHNDCFLADQDDRGTFGGNRAFRKYWEMETKYLAMGGETCALSSYSACENALTQLANYHWSFLNLSYHPSVIGGWRTNSCFDEISRRLGYRFVLQKATFSNNTQAGSRLEIKLQLKNVGWAAPYNPRDAELVFVNKANSDDKQVLKLEVDPRRWFAGETQEISTQYTLMAEMKGNDYDIFLHLPDPKTNLRGNPAFSIRLANEGVWNAETGYNQLHTISVK